MALAYVRYKAGHVFPIIGGRKLEHLKGNIEALGVELDNEELDEIDNATPFDIGFPMSMLFGSNFKSNRWTSTDIGILSTNTRLESMPKPAVSVASSEEVPPYADSLTVHRTSWHERGR